MFNSETSDIIIIGGGILGNAIATYLSQRTNEKIMVLEQDQFCSGSTSFAASLVTKLRLSEVMLSLTNETHIAVDRITQKLGEPLGERRVGCLHIASSESGKNSLDELEKFAESNKIETKEVNTDWLSKNVSWLNEQNVAKAFFVPNEFYIDGTLLGTAYLKEAKLHGVWFKANTKVLELIVKNGKVQGVITDNGKIVAGTVILAAGIWTNKLLKKYEKQVPYAPIRSLYFITGVDAKKYPPNHPICILPDANSYTRPDSGALLFGIRDKSSPWLAPDSIPHSLHSGNFITSEESWNILLSETEGLRNLVKDFESMRIAHCIAAPCAYTHDRNPIVGKISEIEGLFVVTGCNGAGVSISAGLARVVSEMVMDEKPFVDTHNFRPERLIEMNVYSEKFMDICSMNRSRKKTG